MNELIKVTNGEVQIDSRMIAEHKDESMTQEEAKKMVWKIINCIKDIKYDHEQIAKKLFNNLNDESFGEVYYTVDCIDKKMRSCVYFIKNEYNGLIKIGKTEDFNKRIKQIKSWFLQCGLEPKIKIIMLHTTFPSFLSKLESYYHKQYKKHRKYGEWFDISEEELTSIDNFGDGFDFVENVLICFEEYENLSLKKSGTSFELISYVNNLVDDYILRNYIRKQLNYDSQNFIDVIGSKKNNVNEAVINIINKQANVSVFNNGKFYSIGIKDVEPISFSQLKINKFYEDYNYWNDLINN